MIRSSAKPYEVELPGLSEVVASCPHSPDHTQVLRALRLRPELHDAKLALSRTGSSWIKGKVLGPQQQLIAEDHQSWLAAELAKDNGNAAQTRRRLKDLGYLVTRCEIETLYFIHDSKEARQTRFLQLIIYVETEFVDRPLLCEYEYSPPEDLHDLLREENAFRGEERRLYSSPRYSLRTVLDVAAFMQVASQVEAEKREKIRGRSYTLTDTSTGQQETKSHLQLDPGFDKYPWKGQRMFDDWTLSSAGRSGARLCEHWVLDTSDHDDGLGQRYVSFVPMWTYLKPVAEIGWVPNIHTLFGKLQSLDRRLKVPFGWYFYMLHGNKVKDGVGKRILAAAESGEIVLPEHDYRILKAWRERPYGF